VPDLVAQVPEQGAVRLVHRDPQLRAVHVVTLGEIQCDDAVVVAGDDFPTSLDSRSNASPYSGSWSRLMIGSFSSMSSTTNRRLAFSAAANAANAAVSALLGRPWVSLHDVRAWLLRPYWDSP